MMVVGTVEADLVVAALAAVGAVLVGSEEEAEISTVLAVGVLAAAVRNEIGKKSNRSKPLTTHLLWIEYLPVRFLKLTERITLCVSLWSFLGLFCSFF